MYCAQGITAALLARERSGQGQRVDIGMLDTTAALLTYQAANWFATGKIPPRQGNRHATIAPYETFTTQDGEIVIAVGNDETWKTLLPGDRPARARRRSAIHDQQGSDGELRRDAAADRSRVPHRRPTPSGSRVLNAAGVANGEVRDIGQMLNDPQLAARDMVETLMHPTVGATRVIGAPIKLSENEASVRTPPPVLGQHTDAVLAEIGYDADDDRASLQTEAESI